MRKTGDVPLEDWIYLDFGDKGYPVEDIAAEQKGVKKGKMYLVKYKVSTPRL